MVKRAPENQILMRRGISTNGLRYSTNGDEAPFLNKKNPGFPSFERKPGFDKDFMVTQPSGCRDKAIYGRGHKIINGP